MELKNVSLSIAQKIDAIQNDELESILTKHFLMIAMSRVSIHVATIENSTLVPLKNGRNISDLITENLISTD